MSSALTKAQDAFDSLNDREKKLVLLMGGVLVAFVLFVPLILMYTAISDAETENAEIRAVLRDIARSTEEIEKRQAERTAAEARYKTPAPPLGSFLEQKAKAAGFDRPLEVNQQPEKVEGGFTRHHVRANLPRIGLKEATETLTEVENSPYPVAIERLQIEHFQTGQDVYNVQVGIISFERTGKDGEAEGGR